MSSDFGERLHIAQEGACVERRARSRFDQWHGVKTAAVPMDVLAEPALDRLHVAAGEVAVAGAEVALDRLPQLRGDHAPERVAWEVAEGARSPMHVLEAAEGVRRHL